MTAQQRGSQTTSAGVKEGLFQSESSRDTATEAEREIEAEKEKERHASSFSFCAPPIYAQT